MDLIGDGLLLLFYAVTIAAAAFFVHKVLWLFQYKKLQRRIVDDAVGRMREGNAADLAAWEELARSCWANALGHPDVSGPSTFIRRVEEGLAQVRGDLRHSRRSLESLLVDALSQGTQRTQRVDAGAAPGERTTVLSLRRLTPGRGDERYEVTLDLGFPAVSVPRPPDRRLYELKVKSRYGLVRRALVFFSGAADVVYSSQHVAMMSQNVHMPTSVVVRRLSLVFLIVFFVFLDMIFKIRRAISEAIQAWLWEPVHHAAHHGAHAPPADDALHGAIGTALGFGVWLALYGSIYLAIYFAIRRRYQINVRRLEAMLADEPLTLQSIHRRHLSALVGWGAEYGRSLDGAVEITVRHAEQLIEHYAHRLRRRVAGPALLDCSKIIADSLFLKLPESRGDLQDPATLHKHSLAHHLWPRAEEMGYQVRLAQYRAAWQQLELAVSELRREQPDPVLAHALWRSATSYAQVFAALVPTGMAEELRQAYAQMVTECVAETDRDLGELDRRLGALRRSLNEQLEAARGLVEGRIELTNGQVQASMASLAAEIIHVREQARLEAMAFEI